MAAVKNKILIASGLAVLVLVGLGVFISQGSGNMKQQQEALFSLGFCYFDRPRSLSDVPMANLSNEVKPFNQHIDGWRLVNFGYMFCPDICPINLSLLSDVKTQWDEERKSNQLKELEVVHVTFDPARDTPKLLDEYLTYMNPTFYGLTGELDNIRQLAQQFNMVFIHEKPDDQGHYFITHSDSMALVNPQGQYVGMFKGPYQKEKMIEALKILMN